MRHRTTARHLTLIQSMAAFALRAFAASPPNFPECLPNAIYRSSAALASSRPARRSLTALSAASLARVNLLRATAASCASARAPMAAACAERSAASART